MKVISDLLKTFSDKGKFKAIKERQFNQHVIFIAHDVAMNYFEQVMHNEPEITSDFELSLIEYPNNRELITVILKIDGVEYSFDVNIKAESCIYYINFLEATLCFKNCTSLVYVSSTQNPNDFIRVQYFPDKFRVTGIFNANSEPQYLDTCIDIDVLVHLWFMPFLDIEPFSKFMHEARELQKYSSKKVIMPL